MFLKRLCNTKNKTYIEEPFKNIIVGVAILVLIVLAFRYCEFKKDDSNRTTIEETALIQQEIRNVGKLVVTEGHFSEVITYKDKKPGFMDMMSLKKRQ